MVPRPSLSLGIEEEYQIIDPETREMRSFITQFIDDDRIVMIERELKPELHQSMVELGTPPCLTIHQLHEELAKQRRFIVGLAEQKDLAVVAAATHPFSRWLDQPVTPLPRPCKQPFGVLPSPTSLRRQCQAAPGSRVDRRRAAANARH